MYKVFLLWSKGIMDKQITRLLVYRNIQIMPKANNVSIKSTYG